MQWLNDESNIDAWLFDVGVIRIAGSPEAPLLTQIVGPSDLSRKAKADKRASQAERAEKQAFWAAVLPVVAAACRDQGVWQRPITTSSVYVSTSVRNGPGRIAWQLWVTAHGSWICLRIHGQDAEEALHYYRELAASRHDIDGEFGEPLTWDSLEGSLTSVVRWDNPVHGGYRDDPEQWEPVAERLAQAMSHLVKATGARVAALPKYVSVHHETDAELA